MTDESSDAFKFRRAPNGKYYVWGNGEVICVPNGSLRYFGTEHDARMFLIEGNSAEDRQNRRVADFRERDNETR